MLLHRIHLNLRCREVRRDLADPYQMHSTLCRAFVHPDQKCPPGEFLWRLEPEEAFHDAPRVLVQSRSVADWSGIGVVNWLASAPDRGLDLSVKLRIDSVQTGQRFRYRVRANPNVCRKGKRLGLFSSDEQREWFVRTGGHHGFVPDTMHLSEERMLRAEQHSGNHIHVFSVLFDGILSVVDPVPFRNAVKSGIGRGKAVGLGLFSVAPTT